MVGLCYLPVNPYDYRAAVEIDGQPDAAAEILNHESAGGVMLHFIVDCLATHQCAAVLKGHGTHAARRVAVALKPQGTVHLLPRHLESIGKISDSFAVD